MAVVATYGIGKPKQVNASGGWTAAHGYGGYVLALRTLLRMRVTTRENLRRVSTLVEGREV